MVLVNFDFNCKEIALIVRELHDGVDIQKHDTYRSWRLEISRSASDIVGNETVTWSKGLDCQ